MKKNKLIRILSGVIQEICDRDEDALTLRDGMIRFRQYQRIERNDQQLNVVDIVIDFGEIR